jgi:hypothetical protein
MSHDPVIIDGQAFSLSDVAADPRPLLDLYADRCRDLAHEYAERMAAEARADELKEALQQCCIDLARLGVLRGVWAEARRASEAAVAAPVCPHTEACRAAALRDFAATPDLAARFAARLRCGETDMDNARRCAAQLGLAREAQPDA